MVVLTSLPPPTTGVRVTQPQTKAVVANQNMQDGTLYITEGCISWVSSETGQGFSLYYPGVTLHAISRDISTYPEECIYIMIDADANDLGQESSQMNGDGGEGEEGEGEEERDSQVSEIRFIPADKSCLDILFQAIAECQALHPDQEDLSEGDDEDAGGDWEFYSQNDNNTGELSAEGQAVLNRIINAAGDAPQDDEMETEENGN